MIPLTILAAVALLWLALWLAIRVNSAELGVFLLTLQIMAGAMGKLAAFEFQQAYRLAWLTWRLFRMNEAELACALATLETAQVRKQEQRW